MKNKLIILLIFFSISITKISFASNNSKSGIAIGIIVGEPTGITFKYNNFPILGIAWSFENHFQINCDYWLKEFQFLGPFNWFIGIGGKFLVFSETSDKKEKQNSKDYSLGFRIPIGLQHFIFGNLELFAEIVPGMLLIPSTDFDIDLGIGARYHF